MLISSVCLLGTLTFCHQPLAEFEVAPKPPAIIENLNETLKLNTTKRQVVHLIDKYAQKSDIDPNLIAAIMYVESNFGTHVISRSGKDHGPMQINEWWLKRFNIKRREIITYEGSLKWGTKILELVRDEHRGNGCWWTLYNSHNPHARRKYEAKIRDVFAKIGIKPKCSGVKTMDSSLLLVSATATSPLY